MAVGLDVDLTGIPAWSSKAVTERTLAQIQFEQDLIGKLRDLLPAWKFERNAGLPKRLIVGFKASPQGGHPDNAGLSAQIQLVSAEKSPLLPGKRFLKLWEPGNPHWGNTTCKGAIAMAEYVAENLCSTLDDNTAVCRSEFCRRVPVTLKAGYHSKRHGWVGFYDERYTHSSFEIDLVIMGVGGVLSHKCRGTGMKHTTLDLVGLVVEADDDEPRLKPVQDRPVRLISLEVTGAAEAARIDQGKVRQ